MLRIKHKQISITIFFPEIVISRAYTDMRLKSEVENQWIPLIFTAGLQKTAGHRIIFLIVNVSIL